MKRRDFVLGMPVLLAMNSARAVPELDQPAPPLKGRFFTGEAFDLAALVVGRDGVLRARIVGAKTPHRFREDVIPLFD